MDVLVKLPPSGDGAPPEPQAQSAMPLLAEAIAALPEAPYGSLNREVLTAHTASRKYIRIVEDLLSELGQVQGFLSIIEKFASSGLGQSREVNNGLHCLIDSARDSIHRVADILHPLSLVIGEDNPDY